MNQKNTTAHDIVNDLTIITSTRDNINWVKTFLKSFYQTAFNTEIPIIIVDASTNSNHLLLLNIVKEYPNVKVITSTSPHKHWVTDWEYGVGQCTTKYVISCHIDIVFLLEHWDLKLSDFLSSFPNFGL